MLKSKTMVRVKTGEMMNRNFWRNLLFLIPSVPLLLAGSCSTTTSPPIVVSPPVINSFTATPFEAIGTANATLAWTVTGATALSINQGIGTVTGVSTTQAVSSSKTFTLTASNSAGVSVTHNVTVTIEPVAANALGLNSNLNVNGLNSEKFTWIDNEAKTRTISLVRNNQPGTNGGFMEQFSYVLPDSSTRTINANAAGVRGFGFIVSHLKDASLAANNGDDDSPIGSNLSNAWRVVWRGSNHALLEYTLNYPRWGKNGAGVATKYNMPVTIHWLIQNGKRYPLWSVTFDLSAAPTNAVEADTRAPYGELEFSGNAADLVNGVAWGDTHHFKSTTAPLTLNSSWDWTAVNSGAAYNSLFTPNNAEMGIVGTRVISKQDAGGYEGADGLRGNTSAGHSCAGEGHTMPCLFQWSYQSVNYSFAGNNDSTNNKRFAWGADWGYLGQTTYSPMNNNYAATPGSLPKRSYSTWIVLDPRSATGSPTRDLSDQAKTIDETVLTVTGAANKKLSGAKGIGDTSLETYSPAGFNHVYSTWEADLTGSGVVGLNWQVPAGQSLVSSSIVLNNYTRAISPANLSLNGTALVANQDYFASVISSTQQLWITLKNNLSNSASLTITP